MNPIILRQVRDAAAFQPGGQAKSVRESHLRVLNDSTASAPRSLLTHGSQRTFQAARCFCQSRHLLLLLLLLIGTMSMAVAATRYSVATNNWNSTATWSATSAGPAGASVPVAGDVVIIERGFTVTVTANAACASISFVTGAGSRLTINTGVTLAVSGSVTIPLANAPNSNVLAVGAGTLTAANIAFTNGTTAKRSDLTISTGTVTVTGSITGTASSTSGTITFTGAGTLQLSGNMYSSTSGALTTATGSTVEYNGSGAQNIGDFTYSNMRLSNAGQKTVGINSARVNSILSMEGTATAAGTFTYGSTATLRYNTSVNRVVTSEWITPFTSSGGVVVTNTATISLNASKTMTNSPITVNAGATLNLSTFNLSAPNAINLQCGSSTSGSAITGSGTMTLGGNVNVVSAGVGTAGATMSAPINFTTARNMTVADDGTAAVDLNITSVISGTSRLTKLGAGTLQLTNTNTFTGGVTLSAGTLNINNAQALGTAAGRFIINGGTIDNTSGAAITTLNYPMTWAGSFGFTGSNNLTLGTGAVTMSVSPTITATASTLAVGGIISGAFRLTKAGAGALTLSAANTFTGGVTLNAGTININNVQALGTIAGRFTINGGTINNTSGAALTTLNYPMTWAGNFDFAGANSLNLGTGAVSMTANVGINTIIRTLTVGGVINAPTLDLAKSGAGSLVLGANAVTINNFSINGGSFTSTSNTLSIAGSYTNSGTFVDNAGVVHFNGTTPQSIPATGFNSSLTSLRINNAAGVTLGQNLVTSALTLSTGTFDLSSSMLTVTTITGGSATSYVKTSGTGVLRKNIASAAAFTFPVGRSAYNPVTITNNSGAADMFTVRVLDEVYNNGFSGSVITGGRVRRTWDITKAVPNAGSGVRFVFNWNAGETVGLITPVLAHHNGIIWNKQVGPGTNTATSLTYNIYTGSFSPFSIVDVSYSLPVRFSEFKAERVSKTVLVKWSTSQEQNSKDFIVQHSKDGLNWTDLATITAAGNSSSVRQYSYIHNRPGMGSNFYRIMQRDLDGRVAYTAVASVGFNDTEAKMTVIGNPVVNGQLTLSVPASGVIRIYNGNGQVVKTVNLAAGIQTIDLSGKSAGVYHVQWNNQTEHIILH